MASQRIRNKLAERIGQITATLHNNGINHRDYYLCHLRMETDEYDPLTAPDQVSIYIMDLHRAQLRSQTPERWRVKDLAGLMHSAIHGPANIKVTRQDIISFLKGYLGENWKNEVRSNSNFWTSVVNRYLKTCLHDQQQAYSFFN